MKYEKIVLRGDKEVIYRIPVKGNSGFGIARIHIKQINGEWKVNSLVVYKVSEMQMSSYRSLDVDSLDSITLVPEPLAIFGRKDSSLATHSIFWNKNKVSN